MISSNPTGTKRTSTGFDPFTIPDRSGHVAYCLLSLALARDRPLQALGSLGSALEVM